MKYQMVKTSRLGNRVVNEDRVGVAETRDAVLLVLADGMGGYRGGQIASKTLVDHMVQQFQRDKFPIKDPKSYLKILISDAHLAIIRAGNEQLPPIQPRTTCVVCLIQGNSAWWAHVGDSRLYMFRDGIPYFRTVDHSKVEDMRRQGKLSSKEIENHPKKHLVTRCVGFQELPPVATVSERMVLQKYDMFLLCSDGLWNPLNDDLILESLTDNTLEEAVDRLAYQAEFRSYPSADNISVIAFRWISDEPNEELIEDYDTSEFTETLDALDKAMSKLQKG